MNYETMRRVAKTGDVILVEGTGTVSKMIRVFTGQQVSHVALLLWIDDGLWICEMQEFHGFRLTPASLRIADMQQNAYVYYGIAPDAVSDHEDDIKQAALSFRQARYGYLSLFKVWAAQLFRVNITVKKLVCSTFVQRCWSSTGYQFKQTADPGDYVRLCQRVEPIES